MIYTIGHSNRTLELFINLLQGYDVQRLVDIRTVPRSRHNPQFNKDTLPAMLKVVGIRYIHVPALGGLRRPQKDSINMGWKNSSFRGYADYMQTPEFDRALQGIMELGNSEQLALMCAEAVPWRCHRSLVGDALTVRDWTVRDISSRTSAPLHRLTPWAVVHDTTVTYPPS